MADRASANLRGDAASALAFAALAWALIAWPTNEIVQFRSEIDLVMLSLVGCVCFLSLVVLKFSASIRRLVVGVLAAIVLVASLAAAGAFLYLLPSGFLLTCAFFVSLHEAAYPR